MLLDLARQFEADDVRKAIADDPHCRVFNSPKCGPTLKPITQIKWEGSSILARDSDQVRIRALK